MGFFMAVCVVASGTVLNISSTAIGSCTDYVLYTASEYAVLSPTLSVDEVVSLAGSVLAVWAIAWSIKVLRRAL
jgi:hypothetical protein